MQVNVDDKTPDTNMHILLASIISWFPENAISVTNIDIVNPIPASIATWRRDDHVVSLGFSI